MRLAGPRVRLATAAIAVAAAVWLPPSPSAQTRGLTAPEAINRALTLMYDADFAGAERELARACGPAPVEACAVVRPVVLWWRVFMDVENRSRDQALADAMTAAIERAEAWTAREPRRAEAWFYLGAAYGTRVNVRAYRKDYLGGARDGKRTRQALERALQLDPTLADAHFGIGLYKYYADIAPAVLKLLRWLLALPGGDRVEGMQQMLRTRNAGTLMRSEAAYQLYVIDIWYENRSDRAAVYLDELRARHPRNPLFLLNRAQLDDIYRGDRVGALSAYRALVEGAANGALHEPALADAWGRHGAAVQLDALAESDRAVEELRALIAKKPPAPYGIAALASYDLGRALDRLGRRTDAVAAYRAALDAVPPGDPDGVAARARAGLERTPDRARADAYRLSVEGWRAFERQAYREAAAALDRSLSLAPEDGATWYRRGRVSLALGDRARATSDFDRALAARPRPPGPFVAKSHLEAGHLALASGHRALAASHYENAFHAWGGGADSQAAAERARASLK